MCTDEGERGFSSVRRLSVSARKAKRCKSYSAGNIYAFLHELLALDMDGIP